MCFENGNLNEELQQMYDYGIPLELLKSINKNKFSINEILNDDKFLDSYERLIIEDYLNIFNI